MPQYDWRAVERQRHLDAFGEANWSLGADGGYYWHSSGNPIPKDIVADWADAGLISVDRQRAHGVAYDADRKAFFESYRAAQAARTPEQRSEEHAELAAAFGPGAVVMNVVTGETRQV